MSRKGFLGELEQMVLLAILKHDNQATAVDVSRELEESAGRRLARGALYTTLQRLEKKELLSWRVDAGGPERAHLPRRRFSVEPDGVAALRASRAALERLWSGAERALDGSVR